MQAEPEGLAQAFLIGARFIGDDPVALILGDNIFYGQGCPRLLQQAPRQRTGRDGLRLSGHEPRALRRGRVRRAAAGPSASRRSRRSRGRNYAVTGLYFYDNQVVEIAAA